MNQTILTSADLLIYVKLDPSSSLAPPGCSISNLLLRLMYDFVAAVQRFKLRVELAYLALAPCQQRLNVLLVLDYGFSELCYFVILMLVKRAQHTDARLTRLAVETHHLHTSRIP